MTLRLFLFAARSFVKVISLCRRDKHYETNTYIQKYTHVYIRKFVFTYLEKYYISFEF